MGLKAPTILCAWTCSHRMNLVKLLSNMELKVRERIQSTDTDLKALWISHWSPVCKIQSRNLRQIGIRDDGWSRPFLFLRAKAEFVVFCFGLHSFRGSCKTETECRNKFELKNTSLSKDSKWVYLSRSIWSRFPVSTPAQGCFLGSRRSLPSKRSEKGSHKCLYLNINYRTTQKMI